MADNTISLLIAIKTIDSQDLHLLGHKKYVTFHFKNKKLFTLALCVCGFRVDGKPNLTYKTIAFSAENSTREFHTGLGQESKYMDLVPVEVRTWGVWIGIIQSSLEDFAHQILAPGHWHKMRWFKYC